MRSQSVGYAVAPPRLPVELLHIIVALVGDAQTLAALSRVSHFFAAHCEPRLYREMFTTQIRTSQLHQLFFNTVISNSTKALQVRAYRTPINQPAFNDNIVFWDLLNNALKAMKNLRILEICARSKDAPIKKVGLFKGIAFAGSTWGKHGAPRVTGPLSLIKGSTTGLHSFSYQNAKMDEGLITFLRVHSGTIESLNLPFWDVTRWPFAPPDLCPNVYHLEGRLTTVLAFLGNHKYIAYLDWESDLDAYGRVVDAELTAALLEETHCTEQLKSLVHLNLWGHFPRVNFSGFAKYLENLKTLVVDSWFAPEEIEVLPLMTKLSYIIVQAKAQPNMDVDGPPQLVNGEAFGAVPGLFTACPNLKLVDVAITPGDTYHRWRVGRKSLKVVDMQRQTKWDRPVDQHQGPAASQTMIM